MSFSFVVSRYGAIALSKFDFNCFVKAGSFWAFDTISLILSIFSIFLCHRWMQFYSIINTYKSCVDQTVRLYEDVGLLLLRL